MNYESQSDGTHSCSTDHPSMVTRFCDDDDFVYQYEGGDDLERQSFEVDEHKVLLQINEVVYEPKTLDELVPYEDYVNDKQSTLANLIGKLDYMDKRWSRKFALRQDSFNNFFFGFWGWICNREKVLL